MKAFIRKVFSVSFALLVILTISFLQVVVSASIEDGVSINDSSYYVDSVADEQYLGYGVNYHRDIAYSAITNSAACTGAAAGSDGGGNIVLNQYYPQQVNVLELNATKDVRLVPYAIINGVSWTTASVRNYAFEYENSNPGWKVIAAINGDFFNINNTKESTGVTVSEGNNYKTTSTHGSANMLAIKNSGDGKQLFTSYETSTKPYLTIYGEDGEIKKEVLIDKINANPSTNETSVFYKSGICSNAYLVSRADKCIEFGNFYGKGTITDFFTYEITLTANQFAVVTNNLEIRELLKENVKIRVQYEFTDPSLENIDNMIGFPWTIIQDGVYSGHQDRYRHPRTVIGQKEDGTIVLAVIDGRQRSKNMYGATCSELSAMMTYYGCVDAWNLDGGGSSTLLVRKQDGWDFQNAYKDTESSNWYVTNSPSDGNERSDGNCLLIVTKMPEFSLSISDITPTSLTVNVVQLTELEKFKEIYIALNGEKKKVVDGKVHFDNLSMHTSYKAIVYTKVNDQFENLMSEITALTSYTMPTLNNVTLEMYRRKGESHIKLSYNYDVLKAIKKDTIIINGVTYSTAGFYIYLDPTNDIVNGLKDFSITVRYNLDDGKGEQEMVLTDFLVIYDTDYLLTEVTVNVNSAFDSILSK